MSEEKLPDSWEIAALDELATFQNGRAFKKPEWKTAGLPIIRIQNLNDCNAAFNYTPEEHEPQFKIQDGDLLFAWAASLGVYLWKRGDAWLNQHIFRVAPETGVEKLYLYYLLQNTIDHFYAKTRGSGMVHITKGELVGTQLPLPPLAEQHRIVAKIEELFSELDAGEASLRQARQQLGIYRQSLLKQAFEGKLTEQWRKQNPDLLGMIDCAQTKLDSEPCQLPSGWIWRTLNEVAEVTGGLTKNAKRDILPLRIPYLRVANVYANELRLDEIKDIGVTAAEANKVRLMKGDLMIVEGNGSLDQIGRVAAWNGSIPDCGHQNHLIRARCLPQAQHTFVLMFLLSPHGRNAIEKHAASTSGLHTLSVSKVQRLPIPLCSLPEQREIVRILDEQFTVIAQNEQEIDAALTRSTALRQSILKKAFTGQLVPQDAKDEPASVLLERIRKEREKANNLMKVNRKSGLKRLSK